MSLQTIGWLGSILLAFCGLPELVRTIQDRRCYLGWGMLIMWFLGEVAVFIYVVPKMDFPLLANYGLNIAILSVLLYYKVKGRDRWKIDH